MSMLRSAVLLSTILIIPYFATAQPFVADSSLPDAPSATMVRPFVRAAGGQATPNIAPITAFSHVGVSVKAGVQGIGFDIATPLSRKWNLRGGASFFGLTMDTVSDGLHIDGDLHLRSTTLSADFFPFAGKFHLSPGLMFYNGNHIDARLSVPAGQSFDLGDDTYISSPTDPVHGTGNLDFGSKVAPTFTIGYGNLIPRKNSHWSFPIEFGFAYIGAPKVNFNLAGTACRNATDCGDIATDPESQQDLRKEEKDLADDLSPLRFFPILNVGIGYRF